MTVIVSMRNNAIKVDALNALSLFVELQDKILVHLSFLNFIRSTDITLFYCF